LTDTQPITCLIADDHEVVREGLRLALSRTPHIRVVGEAADGEAAVALAERRRPDVVIMDVRMGGMDGFEAACKIRDGSSTAAVLFFTAHAERNLLTRGREAGARGYLLKEAPHATIIRAIDRAATKRASNSSTTNRPSPADVARSASTSANVEIATGCPSSSTLKSPRLRPTTGSSPRSVTTASTSTRSAWDVKGGGFCAAGAATRTSVSSAIATMRIMNRAQCHDSTAPAAHGHGRLCA